ncbi:hypothetical protein BDV93DRAFT_563896 [Ceratobasidium sp. AG-I]|nr:hypothetical protein BDV93DRAFT_563896 [Ceratobasidium sp. AG-I]
MEATLSSHFYAVDVAVLGGTHPAALEDIHPSGKRTRSAAKRKESRPQILESPGEEPVAIVGQVEEPQGRKRTRRTVAKTRGMQADADQAISEATSSDGEPTEDQKIGRGLGRGVVVGGRGRGRGRARGRGRGRGRGGR